MAKLNKGQAMEAITNRLDFEVATADARVLRLMDFTQLNQSAQRLIDIEHAEFLENVNPLYREHVRNMGVTKIYSTWCEAVRNLEASDPVLVAEKADRSFRFNIDRMIEDAQVELAKFQKRFSENALYAFEWGTDAVQAAANLDVALRTKNALENGATVESIKAESLTQLGYALRLSGSTSPMSNLAEQAKGIAFGKIVGIKY